MRVNVPFGASGAQPSQQIISTDRPTTIVIQNVSAVQFWISDNQSTLDSSLDSSNTPGTGLIFAPNSVPLVILGFIGTLYVRAAATGSQAEVQAYQTC